MDNTSHHAPEREPLPCPHGRLPMGGQDGWKHCPHCLGINRINTAPPTPPAPEEAWRTSACTCEQFSENGTCEHLVQYEVAPEEECRCACHENLLKKPYQHDSKCCKEMNGTVVSAPAPEWETLFNNEFLIAKQDGTFLEPHQLAVGEWEVEPLKDFIRQTLKSQVTQLMEVVKGMKKDAPKGYWRTADDTEYHKKMDEVRDTRIFNAALDVVLSELKKLI